MLWHITLQKVEQDMSTPFLSTTGVKLWVSLSSLVLLLIDGFEVWLQSSLPDVQIKCGDKLIHILLYADDRVLIAAFPDGSQDRLDLIFQQFAH